MSELSLLQTKKEKVCGNKIIQYTSQLANRAQVPLRMHRRYDSPPFVDESFQAANVVATIVRFCISILTTCICDGPQGMPLETHQSSDG